MSRVVRITVPRPKPGHAVLVIVSEHGGAVVYGSHVVSLELLDKEEAKALGSLLVQELRTTLVRMRGTVAAGQLRETPDGNARKD